MNEAFDPSHFQSTGVSHQHQPAVMERVLFNLHHRVCRFWMRRTSSQTRRLIEHLLLLSAILCFGLLVLLHKTFVFRQATNNCASTCLLDFHHAQKNNERVADLIHLTITPTNIKFIQDSKTCNLTESSSATYEYSYSKTKAYLLLEPNDPVLQQLKVQYIQVDPFDLKCFGDGALQFLVGNLGIGRDTVLINWLLVFNNPDEVSFVYHPKTQRLLELTLASPRSFLWKLWNIVWTKLSVLVQTSFLFFFCTTLVSFTLNETQERMLEFTKELRRRVNLNLPLQKLISAHVLHSLIFVPLMVGKMFFLIEFYKGDKFLAFLVMSLVWCVEVYTVLSLRSWQGITYFPRIFFLLFSLFHVYYFANPATGFSYTAFWVIVLFIVHSMMFFWNRYELPAIAFGYITIQRPRANTAAFTAAPQLQEPQPLLQTPPRVQRTTLISRDEASQELDNHNNHSLLFHSENFVPPPGQEESGSLTRSYPSFSTTTSSSSTRNGFLFRNSTDNPNNEDDDDSFVYFMEGEVVVHRQRQSQSNTNRDNQEVASTQSIASSIDNGGASITEDNYSTSGYNASVLEQADHPTASDQSSEEASALQAILEVRLTPRHRNTSSKTPTPRQNTSSGGDTSLPPAFPDLPPSRFNTKEQAYCSSNS